MLVSLTHAMFPSRGGSVTGTGGGVRVVYISLLRTICYAYGMFYYRSTLTYLIQVPQVFSLLPLIASEVIVQQ